MPLLAAGYEKIARRPDACRSGTSGCCTSPWRWARSRRTTSATTTSARSASARQQAAAADPGRGALDALPGYWDHYAEQADADGTRARPGAVARRHPRARAGHRRDVRLLQRRRRPAAGQPAQHRRRAARLRRGHRGRGVVRRGRRRAATPVPQQPLPHAVRGITQTLAEYQRLAAEAAWEGTRADAIRALIAAPVRAATCASPRSSTTTWPHANRDYLPERLLR